MNEKRLPRRAEVSKLVWQTNVTVASSILTGYFRIVTLCQIKLALVHNPYVKLF